jgi:tRNA(Arg) A34 adenosine deaminase TadA
MALRVDKEAKAQWAGLDGPWRTVLQLAWDAYRAGSEPVGAIVVRPDGSVLSRGRNHVYEHRGGAGSLPGGPLAHAAVMALAGLDPFERHDDLTLVTSSEPCALCLGAVISATVGGVRYAAVDSYAGVTAQVPKTPDTERLALRLEGPLDGPFGVLAAALRLEPFVRLNPDGHVVRRAAERDQAALGVAQRWATHGTLQAGSDERLSLSELVPVLWKTLTAAA